VYQGLGSGPRLVVRRYLEVFFRHKLVLILPVVIAFGVCVWRAQSVPRSYFGSTTVWSDTSVPNPSSLDDTQYAAVTPAQQSVTVLQELLATRQFVVAVGHRGPVADYLTKLGTPAATLDDAIAQTLGSGITATPVGPQVLKIMMTGSNPTLIPGTLKAVVDQYVDQVASEHSGRDQASISYYSGRLDAAKKTLDRANTDLVTYQRAHPSSTPASDPTYSQLLQGVSAASNDYSTLQNTYASLQNNSKDANAGTQNATETANFHVIDPVRTVFAASRKKKIIFNAVVGLFVGLLVSLLALAALTASDRTVRGTEDVEGPLELEVVGTVRDFPRSERRRSRAREKSS
jgi:capsular polysaccharide biosynthesis protein